SHDVMIVPLLQGSGMRIKIIEAMALGKCVISTSIGAEGIAATPDKNILIANTADEFKRVIDFLNTNPNKAYEIGERARELVKEQYSAQVLEKEILPFINSILTLEK
ncbi:MAG: glycosyltransferase, partial [Flavobacteriales bacterium]